jgi:photosystem II PsbU protein
VIPSGFLTDNLFCLVKGDYKQLRGMFPHAAGKIASNGPYKSVKDIYRIEGLTDADKQLFRQYEKQFTTNPPGRTFGERINGRVST